jgi:hypothetical protein
MAVSGHQGPTGVPPQLARQCRRTRGSHLRKDRGRSSDRIHRDGQAGLQS